MASILGLLLQTQHRQSVRSSSLVTMVPSPQTLQQMKVDQIKDLLKLEKLPVNGNKAELIARLQKYLSKPKPEKGWQ
eukprot:scaffold18159_cov58-Cyclotella_meneghiniana.AAC.4